jgi:two-component system, NtrC family, nitrogen regulation sensor histidine kinase NtrY
MRRGLQVIASRTESLSRFTGAYARLARLPAPSRSPVVLKPFVQRLAGLETRVPVRVRPGPDSPSPRIPTSSSSSSSTCCATPPTPLEVGGGAITMGWRRRDSVDIWVDDEGPGLSNTANLFVPFFTTKPGGSGIGLVLCRQIAEAHEGSLRLENRTDTRGCRATLTLPA